MRVILDKLNFKKITTIRKIIICIGFIVIVLGIIGLVNIENIILRLFMQFFLVVMMVISGFESYLCEKRKIIAIFLWIVSLFLLYVMIKQIMWSFFDIYI